jgi:hypothetical protein
MEKADYLKLQYQEALNQVRCHIDSRYKVLQFIIVYNAAILTFGFTQSGIFNSIASWSVIFICLLSVFVSIMGLSTEFSLYEKLNVFLMKIQKPHLKK